ncbi:SDR family NAD(P)-dependent oxidoreductase [Aquimarina sp. 2201CG5-10]|uniref:SDR family NAD(P)-dependent oxidoreductase n=1 Tax=Aquimarina callyspongiae TaxID=3098150 RepID=UPI002AB508AA|nr:SDR family NAD(P)-dependent oxidoreductase [Aquimarina sp. 2201CG5-10]MDY8138676.1 SDR family NAD(P)-dependent oxidoreductase [Aquimarina sp. 2201CG5-10]
MKLILITGINKGLGEAIFDHFIACDEYKIIAISRRINKSQEELLRDNKFIYISIDLINLKNPNQDLGISQLIGEAEELTYINNAAIITPIDKIGSFLNEQILHILHLNTAVPLLITNYLFNEAKNKKINLVNISTGAAKRPIIGWSLYCASKAANEMFFETLKEQEKENNNVSVLNIDPGVIDSGMQEVIRNTDDKIFPKVKDFIKLKENSELQSPKNAAIKIINQINSLKS